MTTGPISSTPSGDAPSGPKWQALNPRQRRVAGVLIEKAKTVPDSYPMTVNAIVNGCNQKNNRDPQMELSDSDIEQVLEELRGMGAVVEVLTGGARVPKYKHNFYEWFGVDKVEIAVLAELLLRGEQTMGELRSRASRMEPIADLGTLQNVFKSLLTKRLVRELTAAGRGQLVSHNLYKDRELADLQKVAASHAAAQAAESASGDESAPRAAASSTTSFRTAVTTDMFAELRVEVAELRAEVSRLRSEVQELRDRIG